MDIEFAKRVAGVDTLNEGTFKTTANFQSFTEDVMNKLVKSNGTAVTVRISKPAYGNVFEYEFLQQ